LLPRSKKPTFVIGGGTRPARQLKAPNWARRLSSSTRQGKLIARLGGKEGPGWSPAVHRPARPALDPKAISYVARSPTPTGRPASGQAMPTTIRSLAKLEKVS
jgi:hypothetical protein